MSKQVTAFSVLGTDIQIVNGARGRYNVLSRPEGATEDEFKLIHQGLSGPQMMAEMGQQLSLLDQEFSSARTSHIKSVDAMVGSQLEYENAAKKMREERDYWKRQYQTRKTYLRDDVTTEVLEDDPDHLVLRSYGNNSTFDRHFVSVKTATKDYRTKLALGVLVSVITAVLVMVRFF